MDTSTSVTDLTERRLRDILNFDQNLLELINQGLWMQGVPPLSPIGITIGKSINIDALWKVVYNKMQADHTQEEIAHYVTVISKAQDTIQNAFAVIGQEVEDTIANSKKG